jgi:dTDP-4-amino-4,6-dideoxygalactose transaminase
MIPYNKPFLSGKEIEYIRHAVESGKISGNGLFSKRCTDWLEKRYGFSKVLLTSSGTDALEMAALLCGVGVGDEVIAPSFTFVSTVNAFVLRGASIVFCDTREDIPCIDERLIEGLITPRTRAIVITHYAGIACQMDAIMAIAHRYGLFVVEDAAQAINGYFNGRPLGGIGHFAAFSFHETKNIIAGEGGMLVVNDQRFIGRAEILQEKGTDRARFFRGETDKYTWVDMGSSFLPSEITAAFLYAQLENLEKIQQRRQAIWKRYFDGLSGVSALRLPAIPSYASNNAHMFFLVTADIEERDALIGFLRSRDILAVFHYVPLHSSPFYLRDHPLTVLPYTEYFSDRLVRLPLFFELTDEQVDYIIGCIKAFYGF